jgi:hypothetical protein
MGARLRWDASAAFHGCPRPLEAVWTEPDGGCRVAWDQRRPAGQCRDGSNAVRPRPEIGQSPEVVIQGVIPAGAGRAPARFDRGGLFWPEHVLEPGAGLHYSVRKSGMPLSLYRNTPGDAP